MESFLIHIQIEFYQQTMVSFLTQARLGFAVLTENLNQEVWL
jgi:hypothetical protein